MITDNSEKRNQRYVMMRSIKDYGMGALILLIGVFMISPKMFGIGTIEVDPIIRYIFGGMSVIYGSWRIYRGYKKEYFR